jgi:multiple antibiotic resistance protein
VDPLTLALTFFIVANPIGNSPAIIALIKDLDFERQKKVVLRESFFALCVALFFQYFGEVFLDLIAVKPYTLTYTGGVLLFLVALGLIFPFSPADSGLTQKEPYFVPIATPLIGGPALMTTIMIQSQRVQDPFMVTVSLLLAWVAVTIALYFSPYLNILLKKRGLIALEQLMGMILMLISVQMVLDATTMVLQ